MTRPVDLPSFRVIESALREVTARLTGEVVDPRPDVPDWNEFEWGVARAVCALQGISGLLKKRLRWEGPAHWQGFLDQQRSHMLGRDEHIGLLLHQLHEAFHDAGIPYVPLKGSAMRALQVHAAGDRPQSDIDLLLDERYRADCGSVLGRLGYELLYIVRRHDVYAPAIRPAPGRFGEHSENPLKIEVHTRVSEDLPVETVDITSSIFPRETRPGANAYASLAALLRHVSLHAAGSMRANALRFLHVFDIAQLAGRMHPADWRELLEHQAAHSQDWWLFPPLSMAARHLPGSVPARVMDELRAACPRRLRERYERISVYEVSWSNLRIAAFPGIEWSRTSRDRLRFARSRIWPDRTALDELAATPKSQPQLMDVRWYGKSHVERIARWVFSNPPRVQTISAVTEALRSGTP